MLEESKAAMAIGQPTSVGSVTVLFNNDRQRKFTTKRHIFDAATGEVKTENSAGARYFAVSSVPVTDIFSLSALLDSLAADPYSMIIRGAPRPHINCTYTRRRKEEFESVPRRWVLLDIDGVPAPPGLDPVADPEAAVRHIVSHLPPEFHDVTTHWHLSASAGVKPNNEIRLHLWFWLTAAAHDSRLSAWAQQVSAGGADSGSSCTAMR